MRRLVRAGRRPAVCRPVRARRLLSQRRNAVTTVFNDMQAPVWVLGPASGGRGARVSSAVHRGTFRFSFGCLGWCAVPAPGQAGRSRDTWSRQEDPIRFRILIDIQNLSYTAGRSRSRLLTGSGGRLCATGNSSPEPTTNPLREIPSRLSASTQHQPAEAIGH